MEKRGGKMEEVVEVFSFGQLYGSGCEVDRWKWVGLKSWGDLYDQALLLMHQWDAACFYKERSAWCASEQKL